MVNGGKDLDKIAIVLATSEDWERVRHVRVRALADAPFAFGSRLEEEQSQPESFWRARLESEARATLLALNDDETVGLARTLLATDDSASAELVSMWVAPQARGHGVGRRLVGAVIEWTRLHDATSVELWVTETNEIARGLYESCGFVPTDQRQPLPSDLSLSEIEMRLVLDD